jgi:sodium-dependent dicarboxylate transporter 2/3/5
MTTTQTAAGTSRRDFSIYLLKLASGPAAFVIMLLLPLPLSYQGRIALATFVCAVAWWVSQPMPWAISATIPLLVFPAAGIMSIGATAQLYGHPIFFWIMGTVLIGYAIEKHGIARRFALSFLVLPGIGRRTSRLTFAYMAATGLISMFVSDAATIAMMMPLGMSLVRHLRAIGGLTTTGTRTNFAAFITLGTFYAAVAGGTGTMVGIPHNAIAVSLLEQLTGRALGWFDWMRVGVPVFLSLLVIFYAVLWVVVAPEIREVPSGEGFLRQEQAKLGRIRSNEWRVLFVFVTMVVLFALPTVAGLALGAAAPVTDAIERAFPIWAVPPLLMLLLFTIRDAETSGAALLTWKEAETRIPWNVIVLVLGALAMTEALTKFGFVEFMTGIVKDLGLTRTAVPYVAALFVALTTDLISGTAATTLYCSIFIPAAVEAGYNPASVAVLIANVALGLIFPWAGAAAATAFSVGDIEMGRMIRIGVLATAVFVGVTATIHLLLSPYV